MEITTLRKEVSERDNVIDEKAEELYVLNEKVEQQVYIHYLYNF